MTTIDICFDSGKNYFLRIMHTRYYSGTCSWISSVSTHTEAIVYAYYQWNLQQHIMKIQESPENWIYDSNGQKLVKWEHSVMFKLLTILIL